MPSQSPDSQQIHKAWSTSRFPQDGVAVKPHFLRITLYPSARVQRALLCPCGEWSHHHVRAFTGRGELCQTQSQRAQNYDQDPGRAADPANLKSL